MSAKASLAVLVVFVALLAAPALAVAQSEWVDGKVNPVVPPPNPGDWDGQRYPAGVVKVDGTYHLYYIGRLANSGVQDFQIGHATSTDGVDWNLEPDPVLTRGAPGAWDDFGVGSGGVIHDGSEFRLWYGGSDGEVGIRVGYATSMDGSVWEKYTAGNPIIDVGPPGSFDDTAVIPGTVLFHDGLYRMWYIAARTASPGDFDWRVGYATSPDGFDWTKHGDPVLGPRPGNDRLYVINHNVVFDGTGYHMWYTTDEDTPGWLNIAYAVSPDGIEWTRYPWNPVVGGNSGQPAVLRDEDSGEYTMWYADHPGLSFRRATSECCPGVFYDGFDFGDTTAWSVTVP